jgi:hypothetical protein
MENHGLRTLDGLTFSHPVPDTERLQRAATLITMPLVDGHVIAKGELVGRYSQVSNPPL